MFRSISRSVSLTSALAAAACGPAEPRPVPGTTAAATPAGATVEVAEIAEIVVTGGDVWTMDPAHPRAAAVAWRGDRIIAVGDAATVRAHIGPATRVIDLHGRSVTPGLIDAHGHLLRLGEKLERIWLGGVASEAAAVEAVVTGAKQRAPQPWIFGRGWDQNLWPGQQFPTRASLDAAIRDRPVVLIRVDGHATWVNSAALAAAGITRATPDPAGGKIMRDAGGQPTGVLVDNAMALVNAKAPATTDDDRARRLKLATAAAVAAGLTAVHDMGVDDDTAAVYRRLATAHQLPLRVVAYLSGDAAHLERLAQPPPPPVGRFAMPGVKLYADGALGSRGARLHAGYSDEPANLGLWRTEPAALARTVDAAVAGGWQVAIHAIGDAAIASVLDAYLAAEAAHPAAAALRLRVEHAQVIAARDVPRMVAAHAIASMQPTHATSDMPWAEARVGSERVLGAYAWRTMLDHHIPVAAGSDFPVEEVSPLLGLYAAVTRQNAQGTPPGGWYPDQRMSLLEALEAFTRGAAYAEGAEQTRGVLAVGRRADLTLLSGALAPDASLLKLAVDATIVDGEIVYERPRAND